jgi:hypothetical protein
MRDEEVRERAPKGEPPEASARSQSARLWVVLDIDGSDFRQSQFNRNKEDVSARRLKLDW